MSFDLHLVCLKDGEFDKFPSIIARNALEPFVKKREGNFWALEFPDGGYGETYEPESDEIDGVGIFRASGGDVYDALYEILHQTSSVLVWSFGGCVIADAAMLNHVPEALIESVGMPVVVHSGAEIAEEVEKT